MNGAQLPAVAARSRSLLLYGAVLLAGCALLPVILATGRGLQAVSGGGGAPAAPAPAHAQASLQLAHVLLACVVIMIAAHAGGRLARRIGQPAVVGEIAAGILLGFLLHQGSSGVAATLLPHDATPFVALLAQLGLVLFMFLVGVELDLRQLRGRGPLVLTLSHVSIVVPFLLGGALALVLYPRYGSGSFAPFALFLGAAMSITAFPVLARILADRRLADTPLGAIALVCAAVDDVTAWCLLAVVVALTRATSPLSAVRILALALAFAAVVHYAVRPLLGRLFRRPRADGMDATLLVVLLSGLFLSALVTDRIGVHAIFGAFLFGVAVPSDPDVIKGLTGRLHDVTVLFLLPLFFAQTGLRMEFGSLGLDASAWLVCLGILAVAVAGKWGGCTLTGLVLGMPRRDAYALGALMNARGLTELVILTIGLDLGAIPPVLFTMLVVMALATTAMTTPALALLERRPTPPTPERILL
jgi:Kef-type K+ transport system membrane component KefB